MIDLYINETQLRAEFTIIAILSAGTDDARMIALIMLQFLLPLQMSISQLQTTSTHIQQFLIFHFSVIGPKYRHLSLIRVRNVREWELSETFTC